MTWYEDPRFWSAVVTTGLFLCFVALISWAFLEHRHQRSVIQEWNSVFNSEPDLFDQERLS